MLRERMSGTSLEGWRLRRARRSRSPGSPVVLVTGAGGMAQRLTGRLGPTLPARIHCCDDRGTNVLIAEDSPDVVILCVAPDETCDLRERRVRLLSSAVARHGADPVLILAARDGLGLSLSAASASGLNPCLILSAGGLPRAAAEAERLARALDTSRAQIDVPVIGGDAPEGLRSLDRYASVAGVPTGSLLARPLRAGHLKEPGEEHLLRAAAVLAHAVVCDTRRVLCCGAWIDGSFGMTGGYVVAPVRVGAGGAASPLPLKLTLDERAFLHRAAAIPGS